MKCPRCQREISPGARLCPECGAPTGETPRGIRGSATDVQPVLNAVAKTAARLCDANDAVIFRVDGDQLRLVAKYGPLRTTRKFDEPFPISRGTPAGRAVVERRTIHVRDLSSAAGRDFPESAGRAIGVRTNLSTPLLLGASPVGVIAIRRLKVRPFTAKQIALLKTFADQAAIAIEKARLAQELEAQKRDLTEALEQQTATSEILRVISSSPTDIQPVLDAIAENAARLCDANDVIIQRVDGDTIRPVAHYGSMAIQRQVGWPISRGSVTGRAVVDRRTVHVHDLAAESDAEYPVGKLHQREVGHRTTLATPLLREGTAIGVILIRRMEVRPFNENQIKLLETFADQAVIAIENVRLFQELQARTQELTRSVGELKALGEVSQTVSSTLDLQQVLTTIVTQAVQLSEADAGTIYEFDEAEQVFVPRANYGISADLVEALRHSRQRIGDQSTIGQAAANRSPFQIPDLLNEPQYPVPFVQQAGFRALLAVPLLREDRILGALVVRRKAPGEFPKEIVDLLQTFATQSALAIQNAHLFQEIQDKSQQLAAASQHKSEFLANMSHELRTPLNAIIGFSDVLLERMFGEVNEKQTEYLHDILSSGQHLLSLINDILDLSKVEAGRMELALAPFDLPQALDNAVTLVKERAARHGIALTLEVDPRLGDLMGDERKIKQVLLNLLSNAVKFTPEGGRISLKAVLSDGSVEISVNDTGIGIAPEDQEAIFEEFRQVGGDDARKREGTGLGLTLAKKFVEMHGGRIWVKSKVGEGSTFAFTLPVRP